MNNATGVKPGVVRLLRFLGERFITLVRQQRNIKTLRFGKSCHHVTITAVVAVTT